MDAGIPLSEKNWTVKFQYNDIPSIERVFAEHPRQVAAIILEPVKNDAPKDNFLQRLRELATREGAVLIFDEMIAAMRFHIQGAHHLYAVRPDLATFGKAVSNGFSFSFLLGARDIMRLGGLDHENARVFLLSQTHASESVGLAACRATLDECRRLNTTEHVWSLGKRLVDGVRTVAATGGAADHVRVLGFDCNPQILCTHEDGKYWPELHTAFHEEVIANGVLIPWTTITWAHGERELSTTFEAIKAGVEKVRRVLESKEPVERSFTGPAVKPVFRKFN
jgi:glutamate-1-semialdehyde 2,1-aminomutase